MSLPFIPLRVVVPQPNPPSPNPTPGKPPHDSETADRTWKQASIDITAVDAQGFVQRLWGQYAFGIDDNLRLVTSSTIQEVLEKLLVSIQPDIGASKVKGKSNTFVTADKVSTSMLQWMKNLNLPYEGGVAKWGIRVERNVSETTRVQTANEAYLMLHASALQLHPIVYACAYTPKANAAIYLVHLGKDAFNVSNDVTDNDADRINQMQLRLPTLFWKAASSHLIMLDCRMENLVWMDDVPIFIDMDPKYTTFAPDLHANCIFYINAILYLATELCLSIASEYMRPGFYLNYSLLKEVAAMHKRGFADSICQTLDKFNLIQTNKVSLPPLQPGETHDLTDIEEAAFAQATFRCNQFADRLQNSSIPLRDRTFPFWKYLGAYISHVVDTMPSIKTLGRTPLPPVNVPTLYSLIPIPAPPNSKPKRTRS